METGLHSLRQCCFSSPADSDTDTEKERRSDTRSYNGQRRGQRRLDRNSVRQTDRQTKWAKWMRWFASLSVPRQFIRPKPSTMGMLRTSVAILLHLAASLAAPVPCEEKVGHLEAEIQELMGVISDQHRYIQELHGSQAQQLEYIPNTHLGTGNQYRDCSEVFADGNVASGLYVVRPDGSPTALSVHCDMNNGGGWTVFQRRRDGRESFDRSWAEYKHGFGDLYSPDGEFWLGNDPLHYLTSQGNYDLRIDMDDFEGNQRYAEYKNFRVDDEKDQYQLHLGEYIGNAGDALAEAHGPPSAGQKWTGPGSGSGVKFSTYDQPNDDDDDDDDGENSAAKCIRHDKAGWWFSRCQSGNLNGHYYKGPYEAMTEDGVVWYTWRGWWYSIKSVVMMIRAADLEHPPRYQGNTTWGKAAGGFMDLPHGE